VLVVVVSIIVMADIIKRQDEELNKYDTNFKDLNLENDKLSKEALAYKFSVEQLEYINDSIIKDLNNTRRELGIKDNQIKQMQSIKTETVIRDSVFFRDTIFRDNVIKLDTSLRNRWYNANIKLEYPNKLGLIMTYKSDLNVFAYSSKEILGTPKKCWLGRLFQKKHNVIRVAVQDKNPYCEIKEKKFVIVE
jgi:hypothetical protein